MTRAVFWMNDHIENRYKVQETLLATANNPPKNRNQGGPITRWAEGAVLSTCTCSSRISHVKKTAFVDRRGVS